MTIQYKGSARTPGPLGIAPGTLGGRIPGPLRFEHVDLSKSTATQAAAKTLAMPGPAKGSSTIIRARAVGWNLSKDSPLPEDVKQGELAVCPIAAILAALAHTTSGKRRINNLITEYTGTSIKTTFAGDVLETLASKTKDDPDYRPPEKVINSNRYFGVTLDSRIEVSNVFYIKYTDGADVDMVYMGSPNEALWPCVIEKAFASKIGSYDELDDDSKHTVNEFWSILVGRPPQGFSIDEKTDLEKIRDAAKAATVVPTVGASRDDATGVTNHHGFAILGMQASNIELFDPHGKKVKLSLADLRKNFQSIFFGNPK